MKNLIQLLLSCLFLGMLTLFTSCTEEEINNFSGLNVLDEPKVSVEMAQKLASGEHFATYEYVGGRIFEKKSEETNYVEVDERDFLPYVYHSDIFIINGNECYVTGLMRTGLRDFIRRGYEESGNENLNYEIDKFLVKKDFNYNTQTSEFTINSKLIGNEKMIIFSISDENLVIKTFIEFQSGNTRIHFYYYKRTDDHDLSNIHSFPNSDKLYEYFEPYLKELYGDRYEELYKEYSLPD